MFKNKKKTLVRTCLIKAMKPINKITSSKKTLQSLSRSKLWFVLTEIKQQVNRTSKQMKTFKSKPRNSSDKFIQVHKSIRCRLKAL